MGPLNHSAVPAGRGRSLQASRHRAFRRGSSPKTPRFSGRRLERMARRLSRAGIPGVRFGSSADCGAVICRIIVMAPKASSGQYCPAEPLSSLATLIQTLIPPPRDRLRKIPGLFRLRGTRAGWRRLFFPLLLLGWHLWRTNSLLKQLISLIDTFLIDSGFPPAAPFLNDLYPDSFSLLGMARRIQPILNKTGNADIFEGLFL